MTINIESTRYTREERVSGVLTMTEEVDAAFVDRFVSAAPFFDGLVDNPEKHTQDDDGTITVERVDPSGVTHITTFTPED